MKFAPPKLQQFSPGLLLAAGFTASILACALAGALPDRLQPAGFYLGLALVFTYTVVTMIHLTPGSRFAWRGLPPVVAIGAGVLTVIAVTAWHQFTARQPAPERNRVVARSQKPEGRRVPEIRRAQVPETRQAAVAGILTSAAPLLQQPPGNVQADGNMDPMLGEILALLNQKARPALDTENRLLEFFSHGGKRILANPAMFRTQVSMVARDLADVQSALTRIREQNPAFHAELDKVLGSTAPLAALNSDLKLFEDSLENIVAQSEKPSDAVATLNQLAEGPRNGTATVGQWVNDCLERLAALRSAQAGEGVPRALAGETQPARAA